MKKLIVPVLLALAAVLFLPAPSFAQSYVTQIQLANIGDPCANPNVAKSSVAISISSATTTQLVALSGTTHVYVCGFAFTLAGTTPTLAFEYGTGTTCGTGTTALTGAFSAAQSVYPPGYTVMTAPSGNALCAVTTGTGTPLMEGVLTYVAQ